MTTGAPTGASSADHNHDTLDLPAGTDVAAVLDGLADEAVTLVTPLESARPGEQVLPDELRLANGDSAYRAPGGQVYATPEHVRSENILRAATSQQAGTAISPAAAGRFLEELRANGLELGVDQVAAARGVLTSGAAVETLVGPAGTGKSFVVGTLAKAWSDPDLRGAAAGRVFGLATSQVATDVLTAEGLTARNVHRWLGTQTRLANSPGNSHDDDRGWRLAAGDLVVVDESAMADTAALAAIHQHTEAAGAKLLLVGDHRQLAAVGAGGAMDLLAQAGGRYELADARRFHHPWEGPASLRLREGDETVLQTYHQRGRLLDAGTLEQAEASAARAWLADTLAGRRSVLVVDTNQQAERLSAQLRAELVRLGRVQEDGVALGRDGTTAGVGDLVAARRNGWELAGHRSTTETGEHVNHRGPINRETYRVTATGDDGSLTVAPMQGHDDAGREVLGETLVLPAGYVAADVSLAYAGTVHATQGATVDTSHLVASGSTSRAAGYVGLTRGRDANTAHVATIAGPADPADGTAAHQLHRDPIAVLAGIMTTDDAPETRSALATATESATEAGSTRTAAELFTDAAQLAATHRTAGWLDQLAADGVLEPGHRARIAAEDGAAALTRILRRAELAGHDPQRVLHDAVADRPLDGARSLTNVIHGRIRDDHQGRLDPVGTSWADWTPHTGREDWDRYLASLADAADQRADQLGRELAADPPGWVTHALGDVPIEPEERETWQEKAATVAAWRESHGHDDPEDALGPAPAPGHVESFAAYRQPGARSAAPRSTARSSSSPTASSASVSAPTSARSAGPRATSATSSPAPTRPSPPTARPNSCAEPKPMPLPMRLNEPGSPTRPTRPARWPRPFSSRPTNSASSTAPAPYGWPTPLAPGPPPSGPRPSSPRATPTTSTLLRRSPRPSGSPRTAPRSPRTSATARSPRPTSATRVRKRPRQRTKPWRCSRTRPTCRAATTTKSGL